MLPRNHSQHSLAKNNNLFLLTPVDCLEFNLGISASICRSMGQTGSSTLYVSHPPSGQPGKGKGNGRGSRGQEETCEALRKS